MAVTKALNGARQGTKRINLLECEECKGRIIINEELRVFTICGVYHGYLHVSEKPGEYDWMKKKSVHKRNKWMEKRLRERGVHWSKVDIIVHAFNLIVTELRKHIVHNVSRYDYYVIRIYSRRQIQIPDSTMKNQKGL